MCKFPDEPTFGQLIEAHNAGDEALTFRCAHTFKGVCLNLALSNIYRYADKITEHYRPENDFRSDDIEGDLAKLKEEYNKTVDQIAIFSAGLE